MGQNIWAGFSSGESVQCWIRQKRYFTLLINHFVDSRVIYDISSSYQRNFLTGWFSFMWSLLVEGHSNPELALLSSVVAVLFSGEFSFSVCSTSFKPFHLDKLITAQGNFTFWRLLQWWMSELASARDESENLCEKKMSQTMETLVICSEPEHNRDVACAWYAVNYSKHCSEVGTSFKRSFWWALFFIFFPSVLQQIYF